MNQKELLHQTLPFAKPDHRKSINQLFNTVLPYLGLWAGMIYTMTSEYPYWITLLLLIPAAFFQMRLFILFHDCCHYSFFSSMKANRTVGFILGVITLTPYEGWGGEHLEHHQTVADLDRRGTGDIWTMTVKEYMAATKWTRLKYWLVRHPLVMFGLGPIWVFFLFHRVFLKGTTKKGRRSVWITNLCIAAMVAVFGFTIGWVNYLLIILPLVYLSGAMGIWLFYIQHQFDPTYWAPHETWDFMTASLHGSSYYKLPKVLQWLSGNIGLHHVHHINARIPNYNLQACYDNTPALQQVKPLTLMKSFGAVWLNLWDEEWDELISFRELRKRARLQDIGATAN